MCCGRLRGNEWETQKVDQDSRAGSNRRRHDSQQRRGSLAFRNSPGVISVSAAGWAMHRTTPGREPLHCFQNQNCDFEMGRDKVAPGGVQAKGRAALLPPHSPCCLLGPSHHYWKLHIHPLSFYERGKKIRQQILQSKQKSLYTMDRSQLCRSLLPFPPVRKLLYLSLLPSLTAPPPRPQTDSLLFR